MPLVPHPAPGQTIASAWGSLVADQVVMTFTTAAQRASQLPAPLLGQTTARNDNPGVLEIWNGTAWLPVNPPSGAWTDWTPTFLAGGSAAGLSLGTGGQLSARYKMIAPYTMALNIWMLWGTAGYSRGTGAYTWSMPGSYTFSAARNQALSAVVLVGSIYTIASAGTGALPGGGGNGTTLRGAVAGGELGSAQPAGWAPSGQLMMTGVLEVTQRW